MSSEGKMMIERLRCETRSYMNSFHDLGYNCRVILYHTGVASVRIHAYDEDCDFFVRAAGKLEEASAAAPEAQGAKVLRIAELSGRGVFCAGEDAAYSLTSPIPNFLDEVLVREVRRCIAGHEGIATVAVAYGGGATPSATAEFARLDDEAPWPRADDAPKMAGVPMTC